MKRLERVLAKVDEFAGELRFAHGERLLKIAVYVWSILSVLVLLPVAEQIWGPDAYHTTIRGEEPFGLFSQFDILSMPSVAPQYLVFVATFLVSLVLGLLGVAPRATSVLNYLLHFVLTARAEAVADGGDRFIGLLLFYLMISSLATVRHPERHPIPTLIRNLAFFSARVQVCLVYAAAVLSKLTGELWTRGEAMYYVLQADEYTAPVVRYAIGTNGFVLSLATYAVVLFQISFPYLIWRNPTRRPMMLIGTFLHLQIALVMGLMSFGFAMIVGYVAFYTDEEARAILARWEGRLRTTRAGITGNESVASVSSHGS